MDLSNLGIVYRVQGRPDEATALFQRAHAIMLAALGPDDPKTHTVARNLASTQVTAPSLLRRTARSQEAAARRPCCRAMLQRAARTGPRRAL